jgi:hypothetical protein
MWMSNLYIMVNSKNSDHNSLGDLCAAVAEAGATVIGVDEHSQLIEAAIPSQETSTIAAMEGVSYVRCVFNYFADGACRQAA